MIRPAHEALATTLAAAAAGVAAGAFVWAAWLTIQLHHVIRAMAVLAEALASTS